MQTIGEIIKLARKKKGLSQEDLAEACKVNIRTIQRLEHNVSEPRGNTLSTICEVLELDIEKIYPVSNKAYEPFFLAVFHLSSLMFFAFPLGNIIIPFLLWMYKKDKIEGLDKVGINLLNFQILWSIITYTLILSIIPSEIFHLIISVDNSIRHVTGYLIYLIYCLYGINIVYTLYNAYRMNCGLTTSNYPNWIKFIKPLNR